METQKVMHMTNYSKITALYSCLSVGDEDRDGGEGNSIQNQKIFLENYARGQHLTNIRHYIDAEAPYGYVKAPDNKPTKHFHGKLKPVERRLATLKKHLEQSDIYFKYKGKKKLTEAEQIRKSVYSILRQEQRELAQHRTQDMER